MHRLLRFPGRDARFAVAGLVTLALGFGGCAIVLSVVRTVLLRPLECPDPEEVVRLVERNPTRGVPRMSSSPGNFLEYRAEARSLAHVGAYRVSSATLSSAGEPVRVEAALVSGEFFETWRVPPLIGRALAAPVDPGDARPEVVLGYGVWQSRFGGSADALGRTVHLDGEPYEVIGVMPPRFRFPVGAEIWTPLRLTPHQWSDRLGHYVNVVGRLAPGRTEAGAQAEFDALSERLARRDPANFGWSTLVKPLEEEARALLRPALRLLSLAAALLLAVVCANVATLLVARSAGRTRELAVRASLGASRTRLALQCVGEGARLAASGWLFGLVGAGFATRFIATSFPALAPRWTEIGIDGQVAALTLVLALATGAVAGLAPAARVAALDIRGALTAGGHGLSRPWRARRLGTALAAAQWALSFGLLVATALLGRSFVHLLRLDAGFDPRHVLTVRVELPSSRYPEGPRRTAFFAQVVERARALDDVTHAGASSSIPLGGSTTLFRYGLPDRPELERLAAPYVAVLPGYLETMRVPLKEGRHFRDADRAGPPVLVVSESLARRHFPDGRAVGRSLLPGDGPDGAAAEIVGVVADVRGEELETPPRAALYGLHDHSPFDGMTVCLRTRAHPEALVPALRGIVARLDPLQPVNAVATMDGVVRDSLASRRVAWIMMATFASTALVVTNAGIYGLLGRGVAESRRDLGLRLALGARRRHLRRLVFGYAARIVAPGLIGGSAAGFVAGRVVSSQLFGVAASDPATYLGVTGLLTTATLLAALEPVGRAVRVAPTEALRQE